MAECSLVSHILHVKVECEIIHIDSIVSKLSACTIADNPSSIATITNNLSHLTLAMDIPVNIPLSSTVCTGELVTGWAAIADDPDWLSLTTHTSKRETVPASTTGCNQRTAKALVILDNIEFWIQQCFCSLLHSGSIDHIGHELHLLCKAMQNISRQTNIVIAWKKAIESQIDVLAAQLNSFKPSDDGPLEINTCKWTCRLSCHPLFTYQ
jgi:hypothetical protein